MRVGLVRVVLGTSCPGYESSWVRVVLGTSRLGYELSWVRVVQIPRSTGPQSGLRDSLSRAVFGKGTSLCACVAALRACAPPVWSPRVKMSTTCTLVIMPEHFVYVFYSP